MSNIESINHKTPTRIQSEWTKRFDEKWKGKYRIVAYPEKGENSKYSISCKEHGTHKTDIRIGIKTPCRLCKESEFWKSFQQKFQDRWKEEYLIEKCSRKSDSNILIDVICKKHGLQANKSKYALHCPCLQCKLEKTIRKNIDEFRAKWGDRYQYTNEKDYKENKYKVICKMCGPVLVQRKPFLKSGCPTCNKLFYTTEIFLKECKEIFGDTYDYSKVDFVNMRTKVIVGCRIHGDFLVKPAHHRFGSQTGCPKCAKGKRTSRGEKEFLDYVGVDTKDRGVFVGKYNVDGLTDDTVYEFYGDLFHGHPIRGTGKGMKPKGMTPDELFIETENKASYLQHAGYTVRYCWEGDWNRFRSGCVVEPRIITFDGKLYD